MSLMYLSKLSTSCDWAYPDVFWEGSVAKNASKTIATTQKPKMIVVFNTRGDSQYRHLTIWDETKQEGVFMWYSSNNGTTPLDSSNLASDGRITSITDTGITIKSLSSSVTYYYGVFAWY